MQPRVHASPVAFVLQGRVQGVGFRWWARRSALRLGVRGTVRNRADGSVEVQAAGPPDSLEAFVEAIRVGPPRARVDAMRPITPTPDLPADFRVLS